MAKSFHLAAWVVAEYLSTAYFPLVDLDYVVGHCCQPLLYTFTVKKMADTPDAMTKADFDAALEKQRSEFNDELKKLRSEVSNQFSAGLSWMDQIHRILTSGIFFIVLGLALLLYAESQILGKHTVTTFVLVVLGSAILLFGTGTQGIGKFESAGYKVALAGGAGVLAIIIAYGIVLERVGVREVFRQERQYASVNLFVTGGNAEANEYLARFTMNGEPLQSSFRGDHLVVLVPYLPQHISQAAQRKINIHLVWHPNNQTKPVRTVVADEFEISLAKITSSDQFYDFPGYDPCKAISATGQNTVNPATKSRVSVSACRIVINVSSDQVITINQDPAKTPNAMSTPVTPLLLPLPGNT